MLSRIRTHCPNCRERYAPFDAECQGCGRVRDQKSLMEIAGSGQILHQCLAWFWVFVGVGIFCAAFGRIVRWRLAQSVPSAAAPGTLSSLPDEERAAKIKKAADAAFWAAKEKREAAEVAAYQSETGALAALPPAASGAAAATTAGSSDGGFSYDDTPGVRGVQVYIRRSDHSGLGSSREGSSGPAAGGVRGKAL